MSAVIKARELNVKHPSAFTPPLVQHFGLVASAPEAVTRLRKQILTLAVQGKLVPQDPCDAPASALFSRP